MITSFPLPHGGEFPRGAEAIMHVYVLVDRHPTCGETGMVCTPGIESIRSELRKEKGRNGKDGGSLRQQYAVRPRDRVYFGPFNINKLFYLVYCLF